MCVPRRALVRQTHTKRILTRAHGSQGERMQFTAHLADLGPSEDHQCEVRGMQLCWGAMRSEGELRNRSQKWLTQTRFLALRACAHALQACSTPMTSGYSAMCRTCTRFQCLSCCRGPAGLGVVCGACSSAMCRQCVDSSPSIAAQAQFWVRLGMQYASPGSALCLACSHHLTGGKEPCTPLPAKHALPEEPELQRGMASLDGVAPTAPQTDAQPRLGAKRPRVSAT